MKRDRIENFTRGWFIGNFEPAILKTEEFEVGFQIHRKEDTPEKHYQEICRGRAAKVAYSPQ